jgi:hypothetical protein
MTEEEPEWISENEQESESGVTPDHWIALHQSDPSRFFAAIFYLPDTGNIYSDRSRWAGQQPSVFSKLMDPEEQEKIINNLLVEISRLTDSKQTEIADQIERWGYIDQILSQLESNLSIEEAMVIYMETDSFSPLFIPAFDSRNIDPEDWDLIDLAATLSSAEITDIRLQIVTSLTLMEPVESLAKLASLAGEFP